MLISLALVPLALLALFLAPTRAQDPVGPLQGAHGPRLAPPVYSGTSIDGDLQAALEQALSRAQQGVADRTGIQDAVFAWDLSAIHGVRGGILGLQDLTVEITVQD